MILNWQLAKEIYGITPWFVDSKSFPMMSAILGQMKSGVNLELPEEKYNAVSYLNLSSETKVIDRPYGNYYEPGQLENDKDFDGIGIININGPITKSGGMSSFGMDRVSSLMNLMNEDKRIKAFLILCDSGGGSSAAVELMNDTITSISKTKPIYALITKGGMACSAMYGIISSCSKIYSESGMNIVGSIGTMVQFEGKEANSKSPDGTKNIRLYATKSTKKNEDFEQALNNDNYELIVSELLDPVNESFLNMVQENRPILKGTDFDNGNTKFSKDAVGTYIDGIKSYTEVIQEISSTFKTPAQTVKKETKSNINNQTKNSMTAEELRQQFPDTYNSIFGAGVAQEKDRAGAWMAHFDNDPEKVKSGLKSGEGISATDREELLVKASMNGNLKRIEQDSTKPLITNETVEGSKTADEIELDNFYKGL